MPAVLAGPPQVRGSGAGRRDLGGGDQGAVQTEEGPFLARRAGQDIGQRRGVGCDHIDRFVQVPVGGRDTDARVDRQDPQPRGVLEPPQHHRGLRPGSRGPLHRPGPGPAPVRREPSRHGVQSGFGHVEAGTIGDQRGVLAGRELVVLVDSDSGLPGPRVPAATHCKPAGQALCAPAATLLPDPGCPPRTIPSLNNEARKPQSIPRITS